MAFPALGQVNLGSISGKVEDASHSPLEAARVTVLAKDTGASRALTTNAAGLFDAVDLAPGEYTIEVEAPAFSVLTRQVTLEVGQNMGSTSP